MTALQIVAILCPGLYSDANVSSFVALAEEETDAEYFGNNRAKAVALRAAHMWALSQRSGMAPAGGITAMTEGKLSMSFAQNGSNATSDLDQTHYGKQLKAMMSPGFAVIGYDDDITEY